MTRAAIAVDRLVVLLLGTVLVAVGAGALVWRTGWIHGLPQEITVPGVAGALDEPWWRWAVASAGLVCVAVALRWLTAHRPALKAAPIRLHDAGDVGTITVDPAAIAAAAAAELERHPAVRTAKGKAIVDRGHRMIEIAVTASHPDELPAVIDAIDATNARIGRACGDVLLQTRATLRIKGGRELVRPRPR